MGKYSWIGKGTVDLFTGIGNQMELDRYQTAMPRLPLWTALGMLAVGGGAKALEKYARQNWAAVVADPLLNVGTFVVGQELGAYIDLKAFGLTDPGPSPSQFDQANLEALAQAQNQAALEQAQFGQSGLQFNPAGQQFALPASPAVESPAFAAEGY